MDSTNQQHVYGRVDERISIYEGPGSMLLDCVPCLGSGQHIRKVQKITLTEVTLKGINFANPVCVGQSCDRC
jgi:hypothetical protein